MSDVFWSNDEVFLFNSIGNRKTEKTAMSADDRSLEYFRSLANFDVDSVVYDDHLTCSLTNNSEIGFFEVKFSKIKHKNLDNCLEIVANSQATVDDVPCGTSVRAVVSPDLVTLEQQHTEFVKLSNPITREVRFVAEANEFVVTLNNDDGKKKTTETKRFPRDRAQGLVLEGANLLVQRLMVQKNMPQTLTLLSLDSSGELCENIYTSLGPQKINVNGKEIEGWGIQRELRETKAKALPIAWQSYLNIDGHLLSRYQVGSPIKMKTKNIPTAQIFDEFLPKPQISKKTLKWEEDLEFRSKFLDRREDLIDDYKSYIYHHPDINALLADFLQSVLILKPENVLEYAAEFFAPYDMKTSDRPLFRFADEQIPVAKNDFLLK